MQTFKSLSKAVNTSVQRYVLQRQSSNTVRSIPKDPLNTYRLEVEDLLTMLINLFESLQWWASVLTSFAECQSQFAHALGTAFGVNCKLRTLGEDYLQQNLQIQTCAAGLVETARMHIENALRNIDELNDCSKNFAKRLAIFQIAVECKLKLKKIEHADAQRGSLHQSAAKEYAKFSQKCSKATREFKELNSLIKDCVSDLVDQSSKCVTDAMIWLLSSQRDFYGKIKRASMKSVNAERFLQVNSVVGRGIVSSERCIPLTPTAMPLRGASSPTSATITPDTFDIELQDNRAEEDDEAKSDISIAEDEFCAEQSGVPIISGIQTDEATVDGVAQRSTRRQIAEALSSRSVSTQDLLLTGRIRHRKKLKMLAKCITSVESPSSSSGTNDLKKPKSSDPGSCSSRKTDENHNSSSRLRIKGPTITKAPDGVADSRITPSQTSRNLDVPEAILRQEFCDAMMMTAKSHAWEADDHEFCPDPRWEVASGLYASAKSGETMTPKFRPPILVPSHTRTLDSPFLLDQIPDTHSDTASD